MDEEQVIEQDRASGALDFQNVPLTKRAITETGLGIAEVILDGGEIDVLEAAMRLRAMRDAIDEALDQLSPAVLDEMDKYGDADDRVRLGVSFGSREYMRYDYSDDMVWREMKGYEEEIAARRKKREKVMRSLAETQSGKVADVDSGEMIEPAKVKSRKVSVVFTFPKE